MRFVLTTMRCQSFFFFFFKITQGDPRWEMLRTTVLNLQVPTSKKVKPSSFANITNIMFLDIFHRPAFI
jgi:hypothetical protein